MNKKVYFAGSIRGGREDADLYKEIIHYIQKSDIVLTEHIGDTSKSKLESMENVDELIYKRDIEWLEQCDVVIAECTTTSLGVGYELGFAESHHKEVHIFYNKTRTKCSAMLTGNKNFVIHPYDDPSQIYPIIDMILQK